VKPSAEVPKYGGTVTYRIGSDPTNFDSGTNRSGGALSGVVYDQFVDQDWTRGPAGSGVTNFAAGIGSVDDWGASFIDSWSIPRQGVWVLQLRQNAYWHPVNTEAGRLMGGRQVTTDDIIAGFKYLMRAPSDSWLYAFRSEIARLSTIEKTGPWEVTIKTPIEQYTSFVWIIQGAGFYRVYPPDVIARYGNVGNWRNAVGTGPFMLVDYVPGSQFVFQRHPKFWGTDLVGPGKGNQLPYVDAVRELIIPDLSTTFAALRTGKLDLVGGVELSDAQSFWKTSPKLEYLRYLGASPWVIGMRMDKSPFTDVRVRQALMLATDFETIKRDYFGGEAEIDVWPVNKGQVALFDPLEKMPESVQGLYRYNPEKAKQLLKEAGYPAGFKTSVVISGVTQRIDELAIYKDMWAKVGIELTIDVKESGVYSRMHGVDRQWEQMYYRSLAGGFDGAMYFRFFRGASSSNVSRVNDPEGADTFIESRFLDMEKYLFVDMPRAYQIFREIKPYVLELAPVIPRPQPYSYNFWWPWLKNYYGQGTGFIKYSWIDQGLKKSMGY